jgi:NADPH:quinone reductase-like Zn-dependent oxidoreductase
MANEAAWIKEPKANVEIGPAPMYTPSSGDVLVKVESIGFNPVDPKIQKYDWHV